jgi:hypothetical protein
MSLVNRQINH